MRIFLLIILLFQGLFSAQLLNENIYERDNRIDLMLSFDTPFTGSIKKRISSDGTIQMILSGVELKNPFRKNLQNSFVESIAITKTGDHSLAVLISPSSKNIKVMASKTIDGFGLRLRILPSGTAAESMMLDTVSADNTKGKATPLNTLQTSESMPGWRYWAVMGVLVLLLLVLWILKKRVAANGKRGIGSWLMPKNEEAKHAIVPEAQIRYQKALDRHNRLLLVEFSGKQYLIVAGNNNLLLDTFTKGGTEEEDTFTRVFEDNKKQLDNFLKENHPDAYETFKSNASKEEYP
ncbi:hypothetical protein [Hydrogenimonas sp.]